MHKSDRLFQLIHLLLKRQPLSAQALADELSVSIRSIYRYLNDLSATGVPVYHDEEHGYRLSQGYQLPILSLNQEEFDALVTGVTLVKSWTGSQFAQAAHSLLNKMQAASDNPLIDLNFNAVASPILFDRSVQARYWDQMQLAIRQKTVLHILYVDEHKQQSERCLFPLGLAFWGGVWTVSAWCFLRRQYRSFRLDRINHLQESPEQHHLPDHVSLDDFCKHCDTD